MIIFLDIDGVLNQLQSWYVDEKCVKILGILCNKLNAAVVLTSSWKPGYCRDFDKCSPQIQNLLSMCKDHNIQIVGRTRDFHDRSEEIKDYCYRHDVSDYIILDDDSSIFSDTENLYLVNYRTGLTRRDVKGVVRMYGKREIFAYPQS